MVLKKLLDPKAIAERRHYMHGVSRRVAIVFSLLIAAYLLHKIFTKMYDRDIIGAILFIIIFTIGLAVYYISLFNDKKIHKIEFVISLLLIFILTISMFGIIYSQPILDPDSHFIQYGKAMNLTFSDSLYFSTTTITTLGSNIDPEGDYKYFVMVEVILGLVYMGAIVYFITRVIDEDLKERNNKR